MKYRILDKIALAIILAGIVLGCGSIYLASEEPKMIYTSPNLPPYYQHQDLSRNTYEPIIRLEKQLKGKNGFFCSAVVISDNYAVTAAHCLMSDSKLSPGLIKEEFNAVSVKDINGLVEVIPVKAVAINNRADYGLVLGDFRQFTKMRLMNKPEDIMQLGPALYTCGFPWGAEGICYRAVPTGIFFSQLQMNGILFPGMSGGPVIDVMAGGVFAVNSAVGDGAIVVSPLVGLFETLGVEVLE